MATKREWPPRPVAASLAHRQKISLRRSLCASRPRWTAVAEVHAWRMHLAQSLAEEGCGTGTDALGQRAGAGRATCSVRQQHHALACGGTWRLDQLERCRP